MTVSPRIRVVAICIGFIANVGCDSEQRTFRPPVEPTDTRTPPPTTQPTVDASGTYTLTIEADSTCADLPQAVRRRTYQATIAKTHQANYFTIAIVGGGFQDAVTPGQLWTRGPGGTLEWDDAAFCSNFMEPLDGSKLLNICGDGDVQIADTSVSAALAGWIVVYDEINGWLQEIVACRGKHQFTFRR
jgi:hypothetical protein